MAKNKKKITMASLELSDDLKAEIAEYCKVRGQMSRSVFIRQAILEKLAAAEISDIAEKQTHCAARPDYS